MEISDNDFYFVSEPTTYAVGQEGGPTYRPRDFDAKCCPSPDELTQHFETLRLRWLEIVGPELARITRPLAFTREKARRLLVLASHSVLPPWGGWSHLSSVEVKRRTFTRLRSAVNSAIAPHEVEHIDFTTEAEPTIPPDAAR